MNTHLGQAISVAHSREVQGIAKSGIGKAISYLLNRSKYIQRYLEDGKIEIDNNLVEPRRAHERRSPRELL